MSFLGKVFGEAAGETAKGLMEGVGSLAGDIRRAITGELPPDVQLKLQTLAQQAEDLKVDGQMKINMIEASHRSIFIAGWRPFIGWVGGLSIAWCYLVHPIVQWIITIRYFKNPIVVNGSIIPLEKLIPPSLDLTGLWPVIIGMLGLGVYRTYEKTKDVQGKH